MNAAVGIVIYERVNRIALLAYVASIPFASVAIAPELSLSFVAAILFFASKVVGVVLLQRLPKLGPESFTIGLLLVYLIAREAVMPGVRFDRAYHGTFVLNYIMFVAMLDEFKKEASSASQSMIVFSAIVATIATLTLLGWGSEVSQASRVTFLGINENEMALSCLMAFTGVSLCMHGEPVRTKSQQIVLYAMSIVLILASIATGTRFTLFVLMLHLVLLLAYLVAYQRQNWRRIAVAASWLLLVVVATTSSQTMVERLDPAVGAGRGDSSGVLELGGRLDMWRYALQAFQQSPFFGLGHAGYESFQMQTRGIFSLPHNLVMEMAAIGGLVGLALLFVLLLQLAKRLYVVVRAGAPGIVLSSLPLIAAVLFLNVIPIKAVWFLLAFLLAGRPEGRLTSLTHSPSGSDAKLSSVSSGR